MISHEALLKQLKKLKFNPNGWGRTEVNELCNILMPDEEIEELVNGYYEAGFALLVATKERVLLVDKKPLNYLTVEDMRFDMISEFDYSHRIIGAHVSITAGNKTLHFTSLNQVRLRRLLTYVQARMTELKKTLHQHQENQRQHLEEMNEQLKQYLASAQQQAEEAQERLYEVARQPGQSERGDYVLPQPVVQPHTIKSAAGFEEAAAASMALAPENLSTLTNEAATKADDILFPRKRTITPQQLGVAAARRVLPIIRGYSGQSANTTVQSGAPHYAAGSR